MTRTPADKLAAIVTDLVDEAFESTELPKGLGVEIVAMVERPLIQRVLERYRGHLSNTADCLGINRNTLRKRMRAYRIGVEP